MTLAELIRDLPLAVARGPAAVDIVSVEEDSRLVDAGAIFVARRGTQTDGRGHVIDAIARGAVAVVCDDAQAVVDAIESSACGHAPTTVTVIAASPEMPLAAIGAILAERVCGSPTRLLDLVGVTGTNGKTTTCYLVRQLLDHAGIRCGLSGTVVTHDGVTSRAASLTTPGAPALSRLMRDMVRNDCRAAAIEVSSHALDQGRTAGLSFAAAVFTNLTGDHLDYHRTVEAYAAAKAKLFDSLDPMATAIVNADDRWSSRMVQACRARVVRCTLGDGPADARAIVLEAGLHGMRLRLAGPWGTVETHVPLVGLHNAMNALQAVAAAYAVGAPAASLADGLAACAAPPGRLEPVEVAGSGVTVLVDYAHTDDALDNALRALRPLVPGGARLHAVFGCGGDRDRTKRPRMAAAAWRWADRVTVTSDNPRTEDPAAIVGEILTGVPTDHRDDTLAIVDRAEAIDRAVADADPGDVVLIAGKGHEDYQIIGTTRRPFDDRLVARAALERRRAHGRGTAPPASGGRCA